VDQFLALLTLIVLASIAAAMIVLICYFAPKIRRRHQDEEPEYCDSCSRIVDPHSPYHCYLCLTWLCSEPCERKHRQRRHRVTVGPARGPEAA